MDKEGNKESEMEMMMVGISLLFSSLIPSWPLLLSIEGGGCSHARGFFYYHGLVFPIKTEREMHQEENDKE